MQSTAASPSTSAPSTNAGERRVAPLLSPGLIALLVLSGIGIMAAPQLIVRAPDEAVMGFVQRIFYFHVPCAWMALLAAIVCGVASGQFLFRGSERADRVAVSAAELTVLFGLCVVVTGPLWAHKAWGVWWQWDVRLTSTLLMWIIFVSYLFARKYGGPGGRRLAAGLALFGVADVPLIYLSVSLWRTIHPKTTVISTLDPAMRPALYTSAFTFLFLFLALLLMRLRLERAKTEYNTLYLQAQDAGLLDE